MRILHTLDASNRNVFVEKRSTDFIEVLNLIFTAEIPCPKERERILRALFVCHRQRPNFWHSKGPCLGRSSKQRKNSLPAWSDENISRAVIAWIDDAFGFPAFAEIRHAYFSGGEVSEILSARREIVGRYWIAKEKKPAGRKRGSKNVKGCDVIAFPIQTTKEKKAA